MEEMVAEALPVFFTVTTWASLAVARTVLGKLRAVELRVIAGTATPVPVRVTFCGEPVALSATERLAVSAPATAGLKAIEMVQEAPIASVVPQVLAVWTKEVGSVPVRVMPPEVIVSGVVVLVFFRVATWAAVSTPIVVLAKVRVAGVRVTVGAGNPVPVRVTFCGEPVALSATERLAVSVPAAAGLNATEMVQEAPTASVVPQVFADMR